DTNGAMDLFLDDRTISPPLAGWSTYGTGFMGSSFIPSLTPSANPVFGSSLTLDATNSAGTPTLGLLFIGAAPASIPTNKGGTLLVAWNFILGIPFGSGGVSLAVTIPQDIGLVGVDAFLQMVELDPGAAFGFSFTQGLDLQLGL